MSSYTIFAVSDLVVIAIASYLFGRYEWDNQGWLVGPIIVILILALAIVTGRSIQGGVMPIVAGTICGIVAAIISIVSWGFGLLVLFTSRID